MGTGRWDGDGDGGGDGGEDDRDGGPLELSFVAVRRKVRGGRQGI